MNCFLCEKEMRLQLNFGDFGFFCRDCDLGWDAIFSDVGFFVWKGTNVNQEELLRIKKLLSFE